MLSSRKSTQQGANKFYSSATFASATEALFMAHVPVEPEPAAVAAIAPAEPRAEPEPVPAPPVEVSCFYYFLSLPLLLSFTIYAVSIFIPILLWRLFTLALLGVCATYQRKSDLSFIYCCVLCVR